jgi:hypothetical protein
VDAFDHRVGGDDGDPAAGPHDGCIVTDRSRDATAARRQSRADRLDQGAFVQGSTLPG